MWPQSLRSLCVELNAISTISYGISEQSSGNRVGHYVESASMGARYWSPMQARIGKPRRCNWVVRVSQKSNPRQLPVWVFSGTYPIPKNWVRKTPPLHSYLYAICSVGQIGYSVLPFLEFWYIPRFSALGSTLLSEIGGLGCSETPKRKMRRSSDLLQNIHDLMGCIIPFQ